MLGMLTAPPVTAGSGVGAFLQIGLVSHGKGRGAGALGGLVRPVRVVAAAG